MKKILVFVFILLSYANVLVAQDLIVTTKGDSINCLITKQKNSVVYFDYVQDNKVKSTLIPEDQVGVLQKGYYPTSVGSTVTNYKISRDFSRWRYGVQGGYSYRTGKIDKNQSQSTIDYLKNLKSGYTLGGDVHYFISESVGFGMVYGLNKHKAETAMEADDVTMHYFGASMLNRYILANPQKHIILGVNMGYQSYLDKVGVNGSNQITGNTFGLGFEAGFEQELSSSALLHFNIGYKGSTLTKIRVNEGPAVKLDKENFENLGRLELTVGVKFGK
jgi:hypothetical protein